MKLVKGNTVTTSITSWAPLAVAVVCIIMFIHLAIQQSIRLLANEIPAQYAYDIRAKLEKGLPADDAVAGIPPIDMEKSLAPFVLVADSPKKVTTSTATLHGSCPALPAGVFAAASAMGENRISWQPAPDVRNAIVVLPYSTGNSTGYIVAGHSLKETEKREHILGRQTIAGLLLALVATFVTTLTINFLRKKNNQILT